MQFCLYLHSFAWESSFAGWVELPQGEQMKIRWSGKRPKWCHWATCAWEEVILWMIKKKQYEEGRRNTGNPHTSSMSKESAFSVRSWASKGGVSMERAFSGVKVRSVSSLATWSPSSSVFWWVVWRSAEAGWCSGPVLLCSGLIGGWMLAETTAVVHWATFMLNLSVTLNTLLTKR